MKILINFHSAERLAEALAMAVTDLFAEAGSEQSYAKLKLASSFAHELARFTDNVADAVATDTPVTVPGDSDNDYLRLAVAAQKVTHLKTFRDAERVVERFSNGGDAA